MISCTSKALQWNVAVLVSFAALRRKDVFDVNTEPPGKAEFRVLYVAAEMPHHPFDRAGLSHEQHVLGVDPAVLTPALVGPERAAIRDQPERRHETVGEDDDAAGTREPQGHDDQ
jgi:hypothetical protein